MSLADLLRAQIAATPKPEAPPARDLSVLLIENGTEVHPSSRVAKALAEAGVSKTAELERIVALPRRILQPTAPATFPQLRRPGSTAELRPFQAIALDEMARCGGLFGALGVGEGKCLGKGTPVLLYDGSIVPVEAVKTGDLLMGPDSRPRKVLSTSVGEGPLYLVKPVRGQSWVCNDRHMLTLVDSVTNVVRDISVDAFLNEPKKKQDENKLFTVSVDFPTAEPLPLDPYFLGVWFGDGTKGQLERVDGLPRLTGISISKPDPEIRALVESTAAHFDLVVRETKIVPERSCPTFFLVVKKGNSNPLLDLVNALVGPGLLIPKQYLTASRADRAAFLAGFLDTDGYLSRAGYDIVQKRKDYAESICFLARSLGLRALMKEKQVPHYGTYWRVHISGDCRFLPLRLPRKKAPPRLQKKNPLRTGFTLERLPVGAFYGFTLDGDGRFLLGDFTVTHNTLISLLAGAVLRAETVVLLVPPEVRDQLKRTDLPHYDRDWCLPLDRLHIVAYSELSLAHKADILDQIKPDLIVADEAHRLRRRESARTKRFLRFMKANPGTRFVALSGTMTSRSIKDYAHLVELALRKGSPLPRGYRELTDWADALDVVPDGFEAKRKPGALVLLCDGDESIRSGFRRRLVETPGVVATTEGAVGTSLYLRRCSPEVPDIVDEALDKLRKTWAIGDDEIEDPMRLAAVARQLACGFYYEWLWPDGVVDTEWLEARNNWNRCVRNFLVRRSRAGLDSPLLIFNACARGDKGMGPEMLAAHTAWVAVKDRPEPETVPVWLSRYIIDYAATWSTLQELPGIIWYEHKAVEAELRRTGLPVFGGGQDAELAQSTAVVVCASAFAHGTGKNLQRYANNLLLTPPANGARIEQLIGRTHRPGQEADEVYVDLCMQTDENIAAFVSALKDAAYIEETQGQKQKILYAQKIGW